MAERSIMALVRALVAKARFTWAGDGKELDCYTRLINQPDQPLVFKIDNLMTK